MIVEGVTVGRPSTSKGFTQDKLLKKSDETTKKGAINTNKVDNRRIKRPSFTNKLSAASKFVATKHKRNSQLNTG